MLRACHRLHVPVVARGAGTGLSGGAMPHTLGVTLALTKFKVIPTLQRCAEGGKMHVRKGLLPFPELERF